MSYCEGCFGRYDGELTDHAMTCPYLNGCPYCQMGHANDTHVEFCSRTKAGASMAGTSTYYCDKCREVYDEPEVIHQTMVCSYLFGCPYCGILGPLPRHTYSCSEMPWDREKYRSCGRCGKLIIHRDWSKHREACGQPDLVNKLGVGRLCPKCNSVISIEIYDRHYGICGKETLEPERGPMIENYCKFCQAVYRTSVTAHTQRECPYVNGCVFCHKRGVLAEHQKYCIQNPEVGRRSHHHDGWKRCGRCGKHIASRDWTDHAKRCIEEEPKGHGVFLFCQECESLIEEVKRDEHMKKHQEEKKPQEVTEEIRIIDKRIEEEAKEGS